MIHLYNYFHTKYQVPSFKNKWFVGFLVFLTAVSAHKKIPANVYFNIILISYLHL